jgi:hypothetical protein
MLFTRVHAEDATAPPNPSQKKKKSCSFCNHRSKLLWRRKLSEKYSKLSKQDNASLLQKMLQTTQTPRRGWRISKIKILLLSTGHDGAEQAAMSQRPSQGAARF